jgi:hypothetical protein
VNTPIPVSAIGEDMALKVPGTGEHGQRPATLMKALLFISQFPQASANVAALPPPIGFIGREITDRFALDPGQLAAGGKYLRETTMPPIRAAFLSC